MGRQEKESKVRARRTNLKKLILSTVALSGILAIAVVAPNVLGAMAKLGLLPGKRQGEYIQAAHARMISRGLLMKNKEGFLRLTPKGERALRMMTLEDFSTRKPSRWDGKWRVLIFDIPERNRGLRDKIRSVLLTIGFVQVQQSVWAYPYDCEDIVTLVKADLHVGKRLMYLIVDSIEYDSELRGKFGLKRK
ncbi:MAG: hypothetical protein Q8R25_04100 [bacterium]|nr:hypothetical protein [bacterium]